MHKNQFNGLRSEEKKGATIVHAFINGDFYYGYAVSVAARLFNSCCSYYITKWSVMDAGMRSSFENFFIALVNVVEAYIKIKKIIFKMGR